MDMFALFFSYMLPCLVIGTMAAFVVKEALDNHRRRVRAQARRRLARERALARMESERQNGGRRLYVCTLEAPTGAAHESAA